MKHGYGILLAFSFLLASCSLFPSSSSPSPSSTSSFSSSSSTKPAPSLNSISSSSSSPKESKKVTVFSINDLHGRIEEDRSAGELGLARLSYAIHQDPDYDPDTSLILSAGDAWQGTYLAGQDLTLTDSLLDDVGVKAACLGNHEWDWGYDTMKKTAEASPYPYLACNLQKKTGEKINDFAGSVVLTTPSGVKVGVVGAIGPGEESSIQFNYVQGYSFSAELRHVRAEVERCNQAGTDFNVFLVHAPGTSDYVSSVASEAATSLDLSGIFCGHDHQFASSSLFSVPYVEGGCNGKGYGKITFDTATRKAVASSYVRASSSDFEVPEENLDAGLVARIEAAEKKYPDTALGASLDKTFRRRAELNQWFPQGMIEGASSSLSAVKKNPVLAVHNLTGIRADLPSGAVTESRLYSTYPFSNRLILVTGVKGSTFLSSYFGQGIDLTGHHSDGYCYYVEGGATLSKEGTYDLLVADFLAGKSWFKRTFGSKTTTLVQDGSDLMVAQALKNFIGAHDVFKAADFTA